MSLWKDAQSPALKTEEAALLTALPRHMAAGGAALKTVLRTGRRMGEMRLGAPLAAGSEERRSVQTQAAPARTNRNRAALHQVWKR